MFFFLIIYLVFHFFTIITYFTICFLLASLSFNNYITYF